MSDENTELAELTTQIVSSYVSNNPVHRDELASMIRSVHASLASAQKSPAEDAEEERKPAVSIRSSVTDDAITCLECGNKQKTLKRHLNSAHDLTPDEYRARWGLPSTYPLTAPNYAAKRSELAKKNGLGRRAG